MIELHAASLEHTRAIASAVAGVSRAGDLIVLAGEMGAGKTAFAQGFGRSLGVHEPVTSPTYTLIHSYEIGRITLHHVDLYRLEHTTEVADLGLDEILEDNSILLVEWGDVVDLGPQLHVELRVAGDVDDERDITITTNDKRWAPRWERLELAVAEWIVSS